jgi:osmotically-inducible protein OsmY
MCLVIVAQALVQVPAARGQQGYPPGYRMPSPGRSDQPDAIVLSAIRANPLTAPYPITAAWRNGTVVLSGRVGTSVIHDMAVRTVIDLGYPVHDDLVIDTAEAHRVALAQAAGGPWSSSAGGSLVGSAPYFVYPPPLFGRVDDPFFGFEPPLVSFPPWATSGNPDPRVRQAGMPQSNVPAPGPGATGFQEAPGAVQQPTVPREQAPIKGNLQLTVDMAGQVYLSGVVASELDKQIIENEARNTPGVSQVFSDLRVATQTQTQATSETPPPPPEPVLRPDVRERPNLPHPEVIPQPARPEPKAALAPRPDAEPRKPVTPDLAMARDRQRLTWRIADALARRAPLAGLPISVQSRGDVVTLAGKVPSAYEAMLAYRTVEQTPGVREITDQLQFQVPDENHPNPLRQKGRPEDLEPYLTSQIRRHVGELAHVDRVRVRGDILEIQGTLPDGEDPNRLQAILRSMPLLRDFRLEPSFHPE